MQLFDGEALERIDLEPEPRLEGEGNVWNISKFYKDYSPSQDPDPLPAGPRGIMEGSSRCNCYHEKKTFRTLVTLPNRVKMISNNY